MPDPIIRAANAREKARQEKNQWKARARKAEQRLAAVRKYLLGTEDEIGLLEADRPVEDGSEFQHGVIYGYRLAETNVRNIIDGD